PWDCSLPGTGSNKSAPAANTGARGVNRSASQAVRISERFCPRRNIFQKVSDSFLILRNRRLLEKMIPQDHMEKTKRTARTNRVTVVVWRSTSSTFSSFKCDSLNQKLNRWALKDQPLMAYKRPMLRFLRVRNF